jgi:predicted flap endonuclease-1-like 5' DNA nuclease
MFLLNNFFTILTANHFFVWLATLLVAVWVGGLFTGRRKYIKGLEATTKDLKQQLDSLADHNTLTHKNLATANQNLGELNTEKQFLQTNYNAINEDLMALRITHEKANQTWKALHVNLETDRATALSNLGVARAQLENMRKQLDAQTNFDERVKELEDTNFKINTDLANCRHQYQQDIDAAEAARLQLVAENAQMEREKDDLFEEIIVLKTKLAQHTSNSEIAEEADKPETAIGVEALNAQITNLQTELEEEQNVAIALQIELQQIQQEAALERAHFEEEQLSASHLQTELQEKENIIAALQMELAQHQGQIATEETDIAPEISHLQTELQEKENIIAALQMELAQHQGQIATEETDIEPEISHLQTELQEKENIIAALQMELTQNQLPTQTDEADNKVKPEIVYLQTELAEIKQQNRVAMSELSRLKMEITTLQARLSEEVAAQNKKEDDDDVIPEPSERNKLPAHIIANVLSLMRTNNIPKIKYTERDNLKLIVGVGPAIEQKLHQLKIFSFEQIALFNEELIEQINDAIGFFPGRIVRDNWKEQATFFAQNKETQLSK